MKIGLISIATNNYTDFIDPLYKSADMFFCPTHEVSYFLFTNKQDYVPSCRRTVVKNIIQHEPWPHMTLKRFHIFEQYKQILSEMDYLFYCDADMLFVNSVDEEILNDRVVTIHPGFFNKQPKLFTYDDNPNSTAYIPKGAGRRYYAGGFNGGKSNLFLQMCSQLKNNIQKDLEKNIIAKWHDESHLNHYYNMTTKPTLELTPSYCYPESWNIPFDKKLLALDKNHKEYRSE